MHVTGARPGRNGRDLPLRVGIEELGRINGYAPRYIGRIGRVCNKGTIVSSDGVKEGTIVSSAVQIVLRTRPANQALPSGHSHGNPGWHVKGKD